MAEEVVDGLRVRRASALCAAVKTGDDGLNGAGNALRRFEDNSRRLFRVASLVLRRPTWSASGRLLIAHFVSPTIHHAPGVSSSSMAYLHAARASSWKLTISSVSFPFRSFL